MLVCICQQEVGAKLYTVVTAGAKRAALSPTCFACSEEIDYTVLNVADLERS